jgi:hypothetical protein
MKPNSNMGTNTSPNRMPIYLEIVDSNETRHLLPYGHLLFASFSKDTILLIMPMHEIRIKGTDLLETWKNIREANCSRIGTKDGLQIDVRSRDDAWPEDGEKRFEEKG